MTIEQAIERVQFAYPQIYHACHTRHGRKRTSALRLSARDSEILAHLDRSRPASLSALAPHLGLATSTTSEAVSRLEAHGYVRKDMARGPDRREVAIVLSPKGAQAVRATSVLDAERLAAILGRMPAEDLAQMIVGLTRLADACREAAPATRRSRT